MPLGSFVHGSTVTFDLFLWWATQGPVGRLVSDVKINECEIYRGGIGHVCVLQIFGPVQSILKFKDMDEVVERANNTTYGLAAGVMTQNVNTALAMAHNLEAGSVWLVGFLFYTE